MRKLILKFVITEMGFFPPFFSARTTDFCSVYPIAERLVEIFFNMALFLWHMIAADEGPAHPSRPKCHIAGAAPAWSPRDPARQRKPHLFLS